MSQTKNAATFNASVLAVRLKQHSIFGGVCTTKVHTANCSVKIKKGKSRNMVCMCLWKYTSNYRVRSGDMGFFSDATSFSKESQGFKARKDEKICWHCKLSSLSDRERKKANYVFLLFTAHYIKWH